MNRQLRSSESGACQMRKRARGPGRPDLSLEHDRERSPSRRWAWSGNVRAHLEEVVHDGQGSAGVLAVDLELLVHAVQQSPGAPFVGLHDLEAGERRVLVW